MTAKELADLACIAALMAVILRWLIHFNVGLHWAVCISFVSLLVQPWVSAQLGFMATSSLTAEIVTAAAFASAIILVADHVPVPSFSKLLGRSGHRSATRGGPWFVDCASDRNRGTPQLRSIPAPRKFEESSLSAAASGTGRTPDRRRKRIPVVPF